MENVIEIKNINKVYKDFELKNVSLTLKKGSIIGLIGENGAGKSTLLKLIGGVNYFNSGEIKVFDKDIKDLSEEDRENISFILDELNFPPTITIRILSNILSSLFKSWNNETFKSYLKRFDLKEDKKLKELSKGMKVKLNFAVSLSHNASLFILDEPTNGLDPIIRDEILDILLEIKNNGRTILISSHIVEDLEKICDEIIFIHEGKIILDESKNELINKYEIITLKTDEFNKLDKTNVIKYKLESNDLISFLTLKDNYLEIKNRKIANLNEIMIYMIRGKNNE